MTTGDLSALPPRGYKIPEIREMLGLSSDQAAQRMCKQGKIPGAYLVGNKWRVNRQAFDAFVQGNSKAA